MTQQSLFWISTSKIWNHLFVKIFVPMCSLHHYFFKDFIYLFLERGEGRERGKHQHVVASRTPLTGDLACNPGLCPDRDSKQWSFGSQPGTQSTEPHQPGHCGIFMVAKTWKQPKCPLVDDWIKKIWNIYTIDFYSAIRRHELLPFVTTWMDH